MTAPEATRPQIRELALGELLDVSFRICLAHWQTLLKAVLVVIVPVQIISTIVTADYTLSSFDIGSNSDQTTRETIDELNRHIDGLLISGVLQILALAFATAACLRAIAAAYLGETPDWRASLTYAVRHAGPLLALTVLYLAGVMVGAIAFLLPGIWLYIAWAFALPALLIEGLRGPEALRRSYGLVQGRWWRTFSVIALGFLLAIVISTLARGVFLIGLLISDADALVLALSALAGIVGLAISAPFQAALLTVLYFDTRVRKEAFDVHGLAGELGVEAPPAGAPAPAAVGDPPPRTLPKAPLWPSKPGASPKTGDATGDATRADSEPGTRTAERPRPAEPPPPPPGWRPSPPAPPAEDRDREPVGEDGGSAERARG
ncbi:MAG TPA: glycerophosphoryl diester phosphodiesterase membrane domain-containing protein [Solirubrobacteraceae bacterium]|nr:glycerophosphoryl diester phosphodiesterase membrane domain-containing protein [Solirubrobacteraceae bacterium]